MHQDNISWLIVAIIVVTVIVALCFLLIIFSTIKLFHHKVEHENEVSGMKILNHTRMLQSELQVQEQTFEQIAREIHDNWGQRLTLAKFQLQTIISEAVKPSLILVENLLDELRGFSRSLSATRIKRIGLINAIEEDIDFLKSVTEIRFSFEVDKSLIKLNEQIGIILYRIFQEAESNILKHSKANEVEISLKEEAPDIYFEISDNGIGFNTDEITGQGIGLNNILRRVKLLGGDYQLISAPGQGTKIRIRTKKIIYD